MGTSCLFHCYTMKTMVFHYNLLLIQAVGILLPSNKACLTCYQLCWSFMPYHYIFGSMRNPRKKYKTLMNFEKMLINSSQEGGLCTWSVSGQNIHYCIVIASREQLKLQSDINLIRTEHSLPGVTGQFNCLCQPFPGHDLFFDYFAQEKKKK